MRELDIVEVAQQSGVPASTLRYYDEKGLVVSIGRRGLRRVFDVNVLERLALIELGRSADFSLAEIGRMLTPNGRPQIDRQLLLSKAKVLDTKIRKLTAMRDGLQHAAACAAPSHLECPKFRRLLGLAAAAASSKRGRKKTVSEKQQKKRL